MSDAATDLDLDALHDLARAGHAEHRARQRYGGADLTEDDRAEMVAQIAEQRGQHLTPLMGTHSLWLVWWPSARRIVPVVYAKKRKQILTVLPRTNRHLRDLAAEAGAAVDAVIDAETATCAALVARFSEDEDDGFARAAALIRARLRSPATPPPRG